jgi:hypothetical protein
MSLAECFEEKGKGNHCNSGFVQRWFHKDGVCTEFWYAGCNGTNNNFKTKDECVIRCVPPKDLAELKQRIFTAKPDTSE